MGFFCVLSCCGSCVVQILFVSLQKTKRKDMNEGYYLIILQTVCLTTEACMALMLVFSRFHLTQHDRKYESTRWLLFTGMVLQVVHYWAQIRFGFRAQGDDVGAVVNILFYSPAAYIVSYSTTKMACGHKRLKRFVVVAAVSMALIYITFIAGWFVYRSLHMEHALYMMAVIFLSTMIYFIVYPLREIRKVRRMVEDETANDIENYNIYMRIGTLLTFSLAALIPITIFSTTMLLIFGPLFLLAMFFYMVSFVALGFNMKTISDIIDSPETDEPATTEKMDSLLVEEIERKIANWIAVRGFSNPDVNLTTMAMTLSVEKKYLTQFFAEQKGLTFRMWLSDIRIAEVKRMLLSHKEYTHEGIAMECGYSSRTWMQHRFKAVTGMTPAEWRNRKLKN